MTCVSIENVLLELGIPASIKGFQYILDAVILLDNGWETATMEKIYMKIAMLHSDKWKNVERAIRYALATARKGEKSKISKMYFGDHLQNKASIYFFYYVMSNEDEKVV